ncbi:endoglucanase, partial [Pseudomonas sp. GW456-E7]
ALKPGASKTGGWPLSDLSASGTFVRENILGTKDSTKQNPETPTQDQPAQKNSITVQYRAGDGSVNGNQIRPQLHIKNNGNTTV